MADENIVIGPKVETFEGGMDLTADQILYTIAIKMQNLEKWKENFSPVFQQSCDYINKLNAAVNTLIQKVNALEKQVAQLSSENVNEVDGANGDSVVAEPTSQIEESK